MSVHTLYVSGEEIKRPLNGLLTLAGWEVQGAGGRLSADTDCIVVLPGLVSPSVQRQ